MNKLREHLALNSSNKFIKLNKWRYFALAYGYKEDKFRPLLNWRDPFGLLEGYRELAYHSIKSSITREFKETYLNNHKEHCRHIFKRGYEPDYD